MHTVTLTARGWDAYTGDLCGLDFKDGQAVAAEAPHSAMHQLREMAPVLSGPAVAAPAPTVAEFLAACEPDDLVAIGISATQAQSVVTKAQASLAQQA